MINPAMSRSTVVLMIAMFLAILFTYGVMAWGFATSYQHRGAIESDGPVDRQQAPGKR